MAGRKRKDAPAAPSPRATRRSARSAAQDIVVPDVYREMLSEARAGSAALNADAPERSFKRRKRPGEKPPPIVAKAEPKETVKGLEDDDGEEEEEEEEEGIEFEDVILPTPTVQTIVRDSDDEDEDDLLLEDVDLDSGGASSAIPTAAAAVEPPKELSLNLTAQRAVMASRRAADRRKVISRDERAQRIEVHKTHLLCLLAHVERRNRWCNDGGVRDALRPLLTEKMVRFLNPRSSLTQFGQTESLKSGLQEVSAMFKLRFRITERGLRRALWPEDEDQLKDVQIPLSHKPLLLCMKLTAFAVSTSGRRRNHAGKSRFSPGGQIPRGLAGCRGPAVLRPASVCRG